MIYVSGDTIPNGYLLCNGAEVSQTTYAELYAQIGNRYGTASSGMFKLPSGNSKLSVGGYAPVIAYAEDLGQIKLDDGSYAAMRYVYGERVVGTGYVDAVSETSLFGFSHIITVDNELRFGGWYKDYTTISADLGAKDISVYQLKSSLPALENAKLCIKY